MGNHESRQAAMEAANEKVWRAHPLTRVSSDLCADMAF